jgi:hypothetical protein
LKRLFRYVGMAVGALLVAAWFYSGAFDNTVVNWPRSPQPEIGRIVALSGKGDCGLHNGSGPRSHDVAHEDRNRLRHRVARCPDSFGRMAQDRFATIKIAHYPTAPLPRSAIYVLRPNFLRHAHRLRSGRGDARGSGSTKLRLSITRPLAPKLPT